MLMATIDAPLIQRAASTYRPLATRTRRGEAPETLPARAALTEAQRTGSPSDASTAAWMSLARIGSSRSASTCTTAFSTQPGQRGRCRHATTARRGPPLARTAASFFAARRKDPCSSWFDRTPTSSIFLVCASLLIAVAPSAGAPRGSASLGILGGWKNLDIPRYRDNEGSRFYRAGRSSPEETWQALGDELGRVLDDAEGAFWRKPLRMDTERVRWWHGAIFARHFPHDGGRFRQERAFFGVVMPSGGMRQLEGVAPEVFSRHEKWCSSSIPRTRSCPYRVWGPPR